MNYQTKVSISVDIANRNFSHAANLAEEYGKVYILENKTPRYLLIDLEKSPVIDMTEEEKIDFVAARILKKHIEAFKELAK